MKRQSESESSLKKIAKKDMVLEALELFRNGMALSLPQESHSPSESEIMEVAELGKRKIIDEFMPFIMKSSLQEAYQMVVELETGIQKIVQDFTKAKESKETENQREQERTKALFSKMMDFVCEELKSSLSLEQNVSINLILDPSVKTEMLHKFLGTDTNMDANALDRETVFQSNVDAKVDGLKLEEGSTCQGQGSSGPEMAASAESTLNATVEEKKKFKKFESSILSVLQDIRSYKDEAKYGVSLNELKSNIEELKGFLKENEDFSNDKYREIHSKLVEVVKVAGKVLLNARVFHLPCKMAPRTRNIRPKQVTEKDFLMWCLTIDVDIRECLPSQRNSLKLKKAECEVLFLKNLVKAKLIKDHEISLKWEEDNLGERLQTLIKNQATSALIEIDKMADCSKGLCMEALYFFWKLRSQNRKRQSWSWGKDFEDDEVDEDESVTTGVSSSNISDSEDDDDNDSLSDDDDDRGETNSEAGSNSD